MAKSLEYREYQDSALDAGEYTIRLDQQLTISNSKGSGALNETLSRTLIVQGKRFSLDPADIDSKFPAPGAASDFTHVLPHIVLNLDTLPWQRSPDGAVRSGRTKENSPVDNSEFEIPNYPWLALVVFNESDGIPIPKQITLKKLFEERSGLAPWIRNFDEDLNPVEFTDSDLEEFLQFGEKADDPVSVIDIDRSTLLDVLPSPADIAFLAHARGEENGETFLPTLVANRLPKSGERHSVHLVSLMYCFDPIMSDPADTANYNAETVPLLPSGDDFRLVSLHNWTFYCEDAPDFKEQLVGLNKDPFRLPTPANVNNSIVEQYFKDGFILLPHHLRIGRDAASLYRGPFSPGAPLSLPFTFPVESADALLLYDREAGMLDVSYSAAWTLGRQLALEDKNFALDIYKYKRRQAIKAKRDLVAADVSVLAAGKKDYTLDDEALDDLKDKILDWLDLFQTWDKVPFHYLVPQENLLPSESIRFFRLDTGWLECLQHGALSLGGDLSASTAVSPRALNDRWAFMIRSKVIREFPKLRIEGFFRATPTDLNDLEDQGSPIEPTVVKLTDEILLVTFDTEIQAVDIFLDPVNLYFGFTELGGSEFKDLKNTDGSETATRVEVETAEWRDEAAETRVLNISALASKMQTDLIAVDPEFEQFTSADFALQMVEGAPRVRFYMF